MAALQATVILGFIEDFGLRPLWKTICPACSVFLSCCLWVCSYWRSCGLCRLISGPEPSVYWYGMIVVPLILVTVYAAFVAGPRFEEALFYGDSRAV